MKPQLAREEDIFQISQLYFDVYQGTYPDPLMKDANLIRAFIQSEEGFWFILKNEEGRVLASVLAAYDPDDMVAKAFGAVVRNEHRGQKIMETLLSYGIEYLRDHTPGVDIIYSTTRTVNEAAQTLTEKLGFKKLGIFPNAHRTNDYETHGLAAIIYPSALAKRNGGYKIHHEVASLYEVVRSEVPELEALESIVPDAPGKVLVSPGELEVIKSPKFVAYQYNSLKEKNLLEFEFFPFHRPNLMILSPDQSIELFCHLSTLDGYCVIVGGKMPGNLNFTELFLEANKLLRDAGARYIEVIVRADRPKILDSILKAKFIPCGFFPSFQKIGDRRHDFVVFSRSFEIFDFQNVKLKGINQVYLEEYFKAWKRMSLNPKLLNV